MKTVALHGAKAAGRVALVDDEDYDLVMRYRWYVHEPEPIPGTMRGRRKKTPYAVASKYGNGRSASVRMHCLIMGAKGVDHIDHNGLNNQKHNLRVATNRENARNQLPQEACSSQYKGVTKVRRGRWRAYIKSEGVQRILGEFVSEVQAAYTYDAAARELFGEFAYPNFPEGPTEAMRKQWEQENLALAAVYADSQTRAHADGSVRWWGQREPETCICVECGEEYLSRAVGLKMYCGKACQTAAMNRKRRQRRREIRAREREGRLF